MPPQSPTLRPIIWCGPRSVGRALCRAVALSASAVLLVGCRTSLLNPAGPVGAAERTVLFDSLAIMLAIVVPTVLAILFAAFWFRAGNARARRLPDFVFSGRLELLVWSIPALTVLFLGGVAWTSAHALDPSRPLKAAQPPIEVQVVSLDWKWLFIYPGQGVASVNRLMTPVGVPLHLRITSSGVFNGFFVPALGSQIYAMNGMAEDLNLMAARPGTFHGLSSHFSGDGFSGMGFEVRAVPQAAFNAWVAQARSAGSVLDAPAYARLAAPSMNDPPRTYGSVAPRLFETVVLAAPENGVVPPAAPVSEGR